MRDTSRLSLSDRSADQYLPILWHLTDGVVEMEDGALMAMIHLDGRPMLLMQEDERYAARRHRDSVLRSLFDFNVEIYEHHLCHDRVEPFTAGPFRSGFARELLTTYHQRLQRGLLARQWLLTIIVRPRPIEGLGARIRRMLGHDAPGPDHALMRQLEEKVAAARRALRDYGPRRLGRRWHRGAPFSEIGEAVRCILYGRWSPVPEQRGSLASAIYTDRVICGAGGIEIRAPEGSRFGVVLGLRDYPEVAKPWILDGLLASRARLVMTNRFAFQAASKAAASMALTQRRMISGRDRAKSIVEGLDDALDQVESGRVVMGDHHWSLAIHADSEAELAEAASEVKGILSESSNIAAIPEGLGCFPAYWSQVPGAPAATRGRSGGIYGVNFLSLSSGAGFPRGSARPNWGAHLLRMVTTGHTAFDFDPHVRRVGHTLLLGPTGFGKSTMLGLVACALEQVLSPKGGVCVILDKDRSNQLTVRACGGYYANIRRGVASGMAPLRALENTGEVRSWLAEFVVGLMMLDGKGPVPGLMTDRIRRALEFVMRKPPALRSLGGLRQFLDHGADSTGVRLERWCRGGALGWAFDGDEDLIRLDAGIVGIDNTELLTTEMTAVRQAAAAYQLFRIRERVGRGVRGAVLVDEAASYLPQDESGFAEGFDAFSRELRKGNGLLWLAAHQPEDMAKTSAGRTLLTQTPTKLLFPNPQANETAYRDLLHCSPAEIEAIMRKMPSQGEGAVMIKRPEGSFIGRIPLNGMDEFIGILSADPNRIALWESIQRDLGTDDPGAIWDVYRQRHQEASA